MRNFSRLALLTLLVTAVGAALAQHGKKDDGAKTLHTVPERDTGLKPLYARSFALLIGINKYPGLSQNRDLNFATKDALAMRDVLVNAYGFDSANVHVLLNDQATKRGIEDELASLTDNSRVGKDDRVIIYFSGHGQTVPSPTGGDMGFLIPYDAKVDLNNPDNASAYFRTAVPMSSIKEYLAGCPAKHVLVIADACFSGLLTGRGIGGLSKGAVDVMLARTARQVISAGGKGEETFEPSELGHGRFTAALLEELNARAKSQDVFTTSDLFASIQREVSSASGGKQNPQLSSFGTEGEVLFGAHGFYAPPVTNTGPVVGGGAAAPARITGTVTIRSNVPGARVSVDGQDKGTAPYELAYDYAVGTTPPSVSLSANGFLPTTANVEMLGGISSTLVRLKPDYAKMDVAKDVGKFSKFVTGVSYSPDGSLLAGCSSDGAVHIFDAGTGSVTATPSASKGSVNAVRFSPDGVSLLSVGASGAGNFWNVRAGQQGLVKQFHNAVIVDAEYAPGGDFIATLGSEGIIRVWDGHSAEPKFQLIGHKVAPTCLAISSKNVIASADDSGAVILWDWKTGKSVNAFQGNRGSVACLAFAPDGSMLVTGGADRTVRTWDMNSDKPTHTLIGHAHTVTAAAFNPNGSVLATGSVDDGVILWDTSTWAQIKHLPTIKGQVYSLAFSPDGSTLAVAADDSNSIRIYKVAS